MGAIVYGCTIKQVEHPKIIRIMTSSDFDLELRINKHLSRKLQTVMSHLWINTIHMHSSHFQQWVGDHVSTSFSTRTKETPIIHCLVPVRTARVRATCGIPTKINFEMLCHCTGTFSDGYPVNSQGQIQLARADGFLSPYRKKIPLNRSASWGPTRSPLHVLNETQWG